MTHRVEVIVTLVLLIRRDFGALGCPEYGVRTVVSIKGKKTLGYHRSRVGGRVLGVLQLWLCKHPLVFFMDFKSTNFI